MVSRCTAMITRITGAATVSAATATAMSISRFDRPPSGPGGTLSAWPSDSGRLS